MTRTRAACRVRCMTKEQSMAAASHGAYDTHADERARAHGTPDRRDTHGSGSNPLDEVKPELNTLSGFWTKINNDAIFNLAAMLAYNLLMSAFPILLVILAIGGFLLGAVSPHGQSNLQRSIGSALPGGSALFVNVQHNLSHSAGLLLIVGIVVAIVSGSGLFMTMEWCFDIVFRLRMRDAIRQRLMSIGMLLLYAILIPIVLLASILPATIVRATSAGGNNPLYNFIVQAIGDLFSVIVAAILLGVMYVVVPNRHVEWKEVWKGTLVGAILLVLYETLFPFYVSVFLKPQNYGSTAGFAVVILIFFYYLAFIIVLGAEINSWAAGQRQTAGALPGILHELQAHNTTRGAAGPTAGMPQEDMQHHKGAAAMETPEAAIEHERVDHKDDNTPPKFAESGVAAPGYTIEPKGEREAVHDQTRDPYGGEPRHESKLAKTKDEAIAKARSLHQGDDNTHTDGSSGGASGGSSGESRQSGRTSAERDGAGAAHPVAAVAASPDTLAARAGGSSAMERPSTPTTYLPVRPLSQPAKRALLGVLAAGTVAVLPVLRIMPDLLRDDERTPARNGPR